MTYDCSPCTFLLSLIIEIALISEACALENHISRNSTTLSQDVVTKEDAYRVLLRLAESVSSRLRTSGEIASMISTEIKYATFRSVSHQTSLDTATASTDTIYKTACQLFDELWDQTPIRLLGVRASKLYDQTAPVQMSLFDLPSTDFIHKHDTFVTIKQQKLDKALDSIRGKYGKDIIKRGMRDL